MKPQKFAASTTRAALAKVREVLGEDAVILSNRSTPQGVEVVAIADHDFESMVAEPTPPTPPAPAVPPRTQTKRPSIADQIAGQLQGLRGSAPPALLPAVGPVATLAASGLPEARPVPSESVTSDAGFPWEDRPASRSSFSFVDFVRGRRAPQPGVSAPPTEHVLRSDVHMLTPEPATPAGPAARTANAQPAVAPRLFERVANVGAPSAEVPSGVVDFSVKGAPANPSGATATGAGARAARGAASMNGRPEQASVDIRADGAPFDEQAILEELRTLRSLVQTTLDAGQRPPQPGAGLVPEEGAIRRPANGTQPVAGPGRAGIRQPAGRTAELRRDLLAQGFSSAVIEDALRGLEPGAGGDESREWAISRLASLLACGTALDDVVEAGGVFALTGPTGVGKTTTAAKLAARCAVRYGAASVGLITTDTYRIGAPDQLRIYGKILGVPVQTVHDHEWLQRVLEGMSDRRLVLVDTIGMGQRDARIARNLDLLDTFRIRRLLLVAAASQPEMQDEVISFYRGASAAGVVLTKIDEAVKLAPTLSRLMEHRLTLRYLTNGQRVPEDLHIPDAVNLVRTALRADARHTAARPADEYCQPQAVAGR